MTSFSDLRAKLEAATADANHAVAEHLPLANQDDFDSAQRGRLAQWLGYRNTFDL